MTVPRYVLAVTFRRRLRGLLGVPKDRLPAGQELVLAPCARIHTYGMKDPLDIAFVSKTGVVLIAIRALEPRRRVACAGAYLVIERFAAAPQVPWYKAGDSTELAALLGS